MSYSLGVDIGTSFTAAAIWRDGWARTFTLSDHADSIPSAVLLREDGSLLIGDAAIRRGVTEPDRLVRGFKRQLGDPTPLLLGTETMSRTELTGQLLRFVLQRVESREGGPPIHVTLTIPAEWGEHHRSLMSGVAAQAGLPDVGLLAEPVAVAIHYAAQQRLDPGAVVAVYDLGGGTFDAAIVQRDAVGYALRGQPGGDESVGGEDFDDVVVNHVRRSLGNALALMDVDDPAVRAGLQQVRENAIAAKEALSADVDTSIAVILPGVTKQVRLTRAEFQGAIRIPLLRTIDALDRTITSAGFTPAQLTAVLLAGGSSQIPLVSQLLAEELGVRVVTDAHPKYAVCLGAALAAASRSELGSATDSSADALVAPAPPSALPPPASGAPLSAGAPDSAIGELWVDADFAGPPGTSGDIAALAVQPEVEIPAVPTDIGLVVPADVSITASTLRPRLRYLSDRDAVTIEYPGNARRGGRVLLIAIAVVAALVAVAVLGATQGWFSTETSQVSTVTSTATPPASAPVPEVGVGPPIATTAMPVTGEAGEEMRGVAVITGGLIAVGGTTDPATPMVWIWHGQDWDPVTAPAVPGRVGQLTAVAGGAGHPMIAVGWSADPTNATDRSKRRGEIWVSSDGRRWVSATLRAEVGELTAVVALPSGGWLAAGQSFAVDQTDGDAVMLTSAKGAEWEQLSAAGLDGPGPMELRGMVADPAGGVLAVGARLEGAVTRSGLWRSASGDSWTLDAWLPTSGSATAATGIALDAAQAPALIGAASSADGTLPTLWRSENGALVPHPLDTGAGPRLRGVVAADVGLVVVGRSGDDAATAMPNAWITGG